MDQVTATAIALVKQAMERADVGVSALARDTGIPKTTLISTLQGTRDFKLGDLYRIAKRVGMSIRDFIPESVA